MQEFRRHKLDAADMKPLHRVRCALVAFMGTVPPWSRQEYVALIKHADRQAASASAPQPPFLDDARRISGH